MYRSVLLIYAKQIFQIIVYVVVVLCNHRNRSTCPCVILVDPFYLTASKISFTDEHLGGLLFWNQPNTWKILSLEILHLAALKPKNMSKQWSPLLTYHEMRNDKFQWLSTSVWIISYYVN